jgi:hypothetical protein
MDNDCELSEKIDIQKQHNLLNITNLDNYGFVYCITNKYMPNLCKIGFVNTENKTSFDRAKELSQHTCCPFPFEVEFDIKVKNPHKYERRIHKKLNNLRINKRREFFQCNPDDIIKYFNRDNLIKSHDELEDFPENYFNKYNNTDIMKLEQPVNLDITPIQKLNYNNKLNIIYDDVNNLFTDICQIFIILFRLFISIIYYIYCLFYLIKKSY